MAMEFLKGDRILFQGDSVTDCHRTRIKGSHLGFGYVALINAYLNRHYKDMEFTVINRGVHGNRTINLKHRWERSTIAEIPDVLSILIGINDTWRRYDRFIKTSERRFYNNYSDILERTIDEYPYIKLVLMSPFLLPLNEEQEEWFEDLNPKIELVKQLAEEYDAIYIPLQEIFNDIIDEEHPREFYVEDGVHPTLEGHKLIARKFIEYTGLDKL